MKQKEPNYAIPALALGAILIALSLIPASAPSGRGTVQISITGEQSANPNGTVQFVLQQVASLSFAINSVNFGTGFINTSLNNQVCNLDTLGNNPPELCRNFTTVTQGFVLENDGTINLTIDLVSNASADQFIGGSASLNSFQWRIAHNESSSCGNLTGPANFTEVNTTSPGTRICQPRFGEASSALNFLDSADTLLVNINVTIPYDALAGTKRALLIATGTAV
jgi:hypothetical protein